MKHRYASRTLGKLLLKKFKELFDKNKKSGETLFPKAELVRQTLNAYDVEEAERPVYGSLIGYYFGRRGNVLQRLRAKKNSAQKLKRPPAPKPVLVSVNQKTGQQRWEF